MGKGRSGGIELRGVLGRGSKGAAEALSSDDENEFKAKRVVAVDDQAATAANLKQEPFRETGGQSTGPGIMNNEVVTSLYTWYNFLPLNLWKQFHRLANCYFIFICILQAIPQTSITLGRPTVAPVLTLVLLIVAIKDWYEDYQRKRADHEQNVSIAHRLDPATGDVIDCFWKDVEVGDILEVRNRDQIPADLVVVDSSDDNGICFVMTANLDGETNLKMRKVNQEMKGLTKNTLFKGATIECELPNNHLNNFTGTFRGVDDSTYTITVENILLRGTVLRNTESVTGVVVYTGPETKIQMNSAKPPHKASSMQNLMNTEIVLIMAVDASCCLLSAIMAVVFANESRVQEMNFIWRNDGGGNGLDKPWSEAGSPFVFFLVKFFTYIVIFTNFIPITHVVTLEFCKLVQGVFMTMDLKMYHECLDADGEKTEFPCKVKTSELGEELGMVDYIFSDKTGTLTCNVMEFRKCSIEGVSYGIGTTEIGKAYRIRNNQPIEPEPPRQPGDKVTPNVNFMDPDPNDTSKPNLRRVLDNPNDKMHQGVHQFFLSLSLNHEVVPENRYGKIFLSASNPDEAALVNAAKHFGRSFYKRMGKTHEELYVEVDGVDVSFTVLHTLEFDSARKRSSVLVRLQDGTIMLFTKGADNVILERLDKSTSVNPKQMVDATKAHLEEYVNDGLRTLLVAERVVSEADYAQWAAEMHAAEVSLDDRTLKRFATMDRIEVDLKLIGATAIEDKLQEGVGETIASLRTGGVNVWMLTGDKVGTAVNIGFSCQLISEEMFMLRCVANESVKKATSEGGGQGVTTALMDADERGVPKPECMQAHLECLVKAQQKALASGLEVCLVVDTNALRCIEESTLSGDTLASLFLQLTDGSKSVLCARVSPKQKSAIVSIVRGFAPDKVTLSIGDGANDVPMIQTAHIGVGIFGLEGQQAVNSSDFAIGQFRFLKPLLLVHGRWNLRRCSILSAYMYYKNALLVLPQFYFGFDCLMSGQNFYYDLIYQFWNVPYTFFPLFSVCILDQDVSAETALRYPQLYRDGLQRKFLTNTIFWRWMGEGILSGAAVYYLTRFAMRYMQTSTDGQIYGLYGFGIIILWIVTLIAHLRLCLEISYWNGLETFLIVGSIFIFWLTWQSASHGGSLSETIEMAGYLNFVKGNYELIFYSAPFWYLNVLCVATSILPITTYMCVQNLFNPSRSLIAREKDEQLKKGGDPSSASVRFVLHTSSSEL